MKNESQILNHGLYEQVVNKELKGALSTIPPERKALAAIDVAEASKVLVSYLKDVIQKGLSCIEESEDGIAKQISLVNQIVELIRRVTKDDYFDAYNVTEPAQQLLALLAEKDPRLVTQKASDLSRPETSLAQSSLFTGALYEPQLCAELKKEIESSDQIDMLVSFIKWSGVRLLIEELKRFTQNGGTLRIITTSYMGATDVKAVDALSKLPNAEIKVSYNTRSTRLHAKAYIFSRKTGYSTAYIGSSNISNAALTSGLEWNTKITRCDLPETFEKVVATFEYYWNDQEFEIYSSEQKERLIKALNAERYHPGGNVNPYVMDITPYAYQQEILDRLEAERKVRNHYRNLVVAATGTGKTVISALDYKRFRKQNPGKPCRLLFVAHRKEILEQSLSTFRSVLKDANFGELFVGGSKPKSIDHLFISIQTFNSQKIAEKTDRNYYDYIIVDEFHHAVAKTYQPLLSYYRPSILLGLTATPERMDGEDILKYFESRIAAEIRLPEAIERKLLCPFQYFGVTDTIDLNTLKWSVGGYDVSDLENLYAYGGTAKRRAEHIATSLANYVTDINRVKGLGFCVSVAHAKFMSETFNELKIPSIYLTGQSDDNERSKAKQRLVSGDVRFIFVVDIYNEGVDIPEVDTVLFLRPTESLTVFLQQLGRGLRLSENKECLTVLDFIGQAHYRYNFEQKFAALLSHTTRNIANEIVKGFVSVPKGCHIQLEKVASEYILSNIRDAYSRKKSSLIERIRTFNADTTLELTLANFLEHHHLSPHTIYKFATFSRLCVEAGVLSDFDNSLETTINSALKRLSFIDSRRWIAFLLEVLPKLKMLEINRMADREKRMMQMFYITTWGESAPHWNDEAVRKNLEALSENTTLLDEIIALLNYRFEKIDFIDEMVALGFDCPLDLHCSYSRNQILVAMDFMKPSAHREGVLWLKEKKIDAFFITLNKSNKDYSPTTMYKDYSINENLFHWQSQSTTSETSTTGERYINHVKLGNKVLLFVREFKTNRVDGSTAAYTFLGTATYQSHTGSRPMNITWRLDKPIPAKFLKKTNKFVIG